MNNSSVLAPILLIIMRETRDLAGSTNPKHKLNVYDWGMFTIRFVRTRLLPLKYQEVGPHLIYRVIRKTEKGEEL